MKAIQWTGTTKCLSKIRKITNQTGVFYENGDLEINGHRCALNDFMIIDGDKQLTIAKGHLL